MRECCRFGFAVALGSAETEEDCKYGCYGAGSCKDGKCYCFRGFTGTYCEESVCPVLCSGNGVWGGGACNCEAGWKGPECDVPAVVCLHPDCSGHGQCDQSGRCACDAGWDGEACELRACLDPSCSGHGHCVEGECFCRFGWKGASCEEAYTAKGICGFQPSGSQEDCSGRGYKSAGECLCDSGWTGPSCDSRACLGGCGSHGGCEEGVCVCEEGWRGEQCEEQACPPGCEEHGRCSNGTCECVEGWDGVNCQISQCPNDCGEFGRCARPSSGRGWYCRCAEGFGGRDCSVARETRCDDGKDDDGDGLTDCEDSECCDRAACSRDQLCLSVQDPQRVLMKKQPPPPQASFYRKIAFLVEPDSVQQYPDVGRFNATRVSVLRGRVVNAHGDPLIGVRVTDQAQALYGFTISRGGGMFDFVLNGGGSVTLQFMRKPFRTTYVTVPVGWNRIVRIHDVHMLREGEEEAVEEPAEACLSVNHSLRPSAVPSWHSTRFGAQSPPSSEGAEPMGVSVVADAEAVGARLSLAATRGLELRYFSANAAGYKSALRLLLVGPHMPPSLRLVQLRLSIEGSLVEKTLAAQPNLTYTFGWDRRNVYKQSVTGLALASAAVGYVYADCTQPFWERLEVPLAGRKAGPPDVRGQGDVAGGWRLGIHHHLDLLNAVLEKGDGSAIFLRHEAQTIAPLLGDGRQRPLDCPFCNSPAAEARLFQPLALAVAPDGAVYVGDHNLIRRLSANGTVTTVLELSQADAAERYYLAVDPLDGRLHVSLPRRRQVWRLREELNGPAAAVANPESNYEVVVGTGEACRLGDSCGDGGPVEMAQLGFPKGIAFDSQGALFIADQRRIRRVSRQGLLSTIVQGAQQGAAPVPCARRFHPLQEPVLSWPTDLAMDPLNDRLTILDHDLIYQLSDPRSLHLLLGTPAHCPAGAGWQSVREPRAVAVDGGGRVLVAESDGKRLHRVRAFQPATQRWELVAGRESKCDCHPVHCPCGGEDAELATQAHLHLPSALAVSPNGRVLVAEAGSLRVRAVGSAPLLPALGQGRLVQVPFPPAQELYLFNRFGQHLATQNLLSGEFLFNFTYHTDSSFGRLVNVVGAGGQKVYFIRESHERTTIETTAGRKSVAEVSVGGMLSRLVGPDGATVRLEYEKGGLLKSCLDPQHRGFVFNYDRLGHLRRVLSTTGHQLHLHSQLTADGLAVQLRRDGRLHKAFLSSQSELRSTHGLSAFCPCLAPSTFTVAGSFYGTRKYKTHSMGH